MKPEEGVDQGSLPDREVTNPGRAAVALCGVQFVDVLGVTVVVTALPRMLGDLGATAVEGTVVVTAYAMLFGGLLLVASKVGDRVGHRRVILASLVVFAAASAFGAVAGSVWVLAAARAAQGIAAAAGVPAALRLLTSVIPAGPARRRAVAGWSAAGAAAGAAGFVVGGVFTEFASWRAVFVLFVVLAALLATGIVTAIPRDRSAQAREPVPWASGAVLTGAAMGIVAGASLLGDRATATVGGLLVAAGVAGAVGFALLEGRATHPLVAPSARASRNLRWGAFGSFFNTATTSSSMTVAALYLQGELGLGPLRAAGVLITFSLLVVVGSSVAPRLITGLGWGGALGLGLGVIAAGNAVLVVWPEVIGIGTAAAVGGFGIGVASVAATDMATEVADTMKATSAGVVNTAAQLGTATGTAFVLLVSETVGARIAWTVTVVMAGLAGLAAARLSPRREHETEAG